MLSQALYWITVTNDPQGWFYKTVSQWEQETFLTRAEQRGARKILRKFPFWQEKRAGIPATLHYHVNVQKLRETFAERGEMPKLRCANSANRDVLRESNKPGGNAQSSVAKSRIRYKEAESTQRVPEKNHHAASGDALNAWLACKNELKRELPEAEWKLWVRPAYLLKELSGRVLLIALLPSGKITKAAKAREQKLNQFAIARGYSGVGFTRYPDDHDRERLRQEYPQFYEQMFGNAKRPKRRGDVATAKVLPKGDGLPVTRERRSCGTSIT